MNVLITGGTGSFGQALTAKLLESQWARKICIYSRDEHKQNLMAQRFNSERLRFFIGDIRDRDRLALATRDIQIIIHAAALKIVPLAEYNPFEYVKTNVIGAQNLVDVCVDYNPFHNNLQYRKIIALSTDKAVHPINLYGATKLCAEKIFAAANNIRGPHGPKFSVVRYGNVANSNGSVIPLFRSQIERGEQLTITSDEMTRFWITLDEAVDFVINCIDKMHGGETFVPVMPAFNVKDLAMVMMENYKPENQWCRVIGVRLGEKLHEEIITKEELQCAIKEEDMFIINPSKFRWTDSMGYIEPIYSNCNIVRRMTELDIRARLVKLGVMNETV